MSMFAGRIIAAVSLAAIAAVSVPLLGGRISDRAAAHAEHAFAAGEPGDPKKPFRTIEISMTEGPGSMVYSLDKIEVRRGDQIKFVLRNIGDLAHEFLLDSIENNAKHKSEMEQRPEMGHDEANGKLLEPKTSGDILWRFTKAGTFEFACLIPGHYEAGMKGVVVVR
jgi:uncharacterized cupredoxin-like copper-binding protein